VLTVVPEAGSAAQMKQGSEYECVWTNIRNGLGQPAVHGYLDIASTTTQQPGHSVMVALPKDGHANWS
jgi:hypothetical protein